MLPSRQEIQCWREPAVTRESLDEACGLLVQEGIDRHGARLASVFERAGGGDADAAYAIASNEERYRIDPDEAQGWLWVAACGGHPDAPRELAGLLAAESERAATADDRRLLRNLSDDWYKVAGRAKSRLSLGRLAPPRAVAAAMDAIPEDVPEDVAERPEAPKGPGMVAVGPIGDASSKEGVELTRRFGSVANKHLAFAGTAPRPMEARDAILAEYPWADAVAQVVEGHFAVIRLAQAGALKRGLPVPPMSLPNLLLVGGKGAGKSTLAALVCRIAGIPSTTLPCGGVSDAAGIAPVTRSWSTTRPGAIVQAMATHKAANPALILEEIDKTTMSGSQNGSVEAALLSMVGAEAFHDSSLMADVDVRAVTFIATANDLSTIGAPLRDRFEIVQVPSPGVEDLPVLYRNARLRFCRSRGLAPEQVPELRPRDHAALKEWFLRRGRSARDYVKLHERLVSNAIAKDERDAIERLEAISDPFARFAAMTVPTGLAN